MYAIIGVGKDPDNIEIPCMLFETKQAAEAHLSQMPWLRRCGDETNIIYTIPEELYNEPVPPSLLATLPQNNTDYAKENITYGTATGLHFFTYYHDRRGGIDHYLVWKVEPGEALVGFWPT
jgi:hypothetical protein